ncbi:hypothetical protein ATL39_0126 [Sinobaca qinghaiensis]|uniref:Uncharacterized protein n=1 Tax=Sinobaca qinghaiensis TaxID=342944 RepID=A0A419V752_9BACL|nr:hypothetical protein ATL39_0126 [Sinobaca qinghaiensis]
MLFLVVFFTLFLLLLMGLGTAKLLLFREKPFSLGHWLSFSAGASLALSVLFTI